MCVVSVFLKSWTKSTVMNVTESKGGAYRLTVVVDAVAVHEVDALCACADVLLPVVQSQ